MYELYVEHINAQLKRVLIGTEGYNENHIKLKKILLTYETIINKYSGTTLKIILDKTTVTFLSSLRFPSTPVYVDGKQLNFKAIRLYIEKYIECNNIVRKNNKKIAEYKKEVVSFKLYKKIITQFNNAIIDKIIKENYLFEPLPSFGAIGVVQTYNERKRPNWGESNKKKAEILAKGGIPYIKTDAESITDYKGEKWLSYHDPLDFYIHWHTKWMAKELNPHIRDYAYRPARAGGGKVSIVSKLQDVKKDKEVAKELYNRTLQY